MVRETHRANPRGTVVAYSDNAAVMEGATVDRFYPREGGKYGAAPELTHTLMKVETHNHPTAIAPFPGAATGAGGEIRDEGATGIGAKPKAGLVGFTVSDLRIPGFMQPWEAPDALGTLTPSPSPASGRGEMVSGAGAPKHWIGKPERIVSAYTIMLEGPIGAAAFNNEFGRPNLAGYFRTFEQEVAGEVRGYHKPIMIAGGVGNIRAEHAHKHPLPAGTLLIQLGGPGMLIGMGGGAASSMATGANTADLDFDSVQRGNAEIERRAQEVIDRCWQLGAANPILSIHDVGAGGLSNALPELVHGGGAGGTFDLRAVPSEEPGMAPREIWCNEAQERYVLAIAPGSLPDFAALCARERCPFAVVGTRERGRAAGRRRPEVRQHAGRRSARRDPRQGAADDARRAPPRAYAAAARPARRERARRRVPRAAAAVRRRQDIPGHDRRPHGRRPLRTRSDGRPVAGTGGRRRGHADGLRRPRRRGDGDRRADAARADRRAGLRTHGGRRGDHQSRRGAGSRRCATSSCPRTGWRPPDIPARTPRSTTRCAPSRSTRACGSDCRSRSARTRCRCARRGARTASTARSPRRSRSSCRRSRRSRTCATRSRRCCASTRAPPASCWWTSRAAGGASAGPRWRRSTGSSATRRPISTTPTRSRRSSRSSGICAGRGRSSLITTSRTAGSSRRSRKWRSPRAAASTSRSMGLGPSRCRRCLPKSWARSSRCASAMRTPSPARRAMRDSWRPSSARRRRRVASGSCTTAPSCSTRRASTCIAPGRRRRTRCRRGATIRTLRNRSTRASSTPTIRA